MLVNKFHLSHMSILIFFCVWLNLKIRSIIIVIVQAWLNQKIKKCQQNKQNVWISKFLRLKSILKKRFNIAIVIIIMNWRIYIEKLNLDLICFVFNHHQGVAKVEINRKKTLWRIVAFIIYITDIFYYRFISLRKGFPKSKSIKSLRMMQRCMLNLIFNRVYTHIFFCWLTSPDSIIFQNVFGFANLRTIRRLILNILAEHCQSSPCIVFNT